ncbi:Leucine-rich repeat-containing protein 40 [Golovinomyces cichoracearum]|uniref:Leucine-rich repeat-containing protein 40 n=1 Tax=Golovinomyces cichoracearum TaxID=62708 RepID=A0A420IEM9_9PEZI|nr:Leucine-rich repeat-containing protein 40 [Golovinomyces cichoracearum]
METTRSQTKPSAIPRLVRLPQAGTTLSYTEPGEALCPVKSSLSYPRLRHSTSRDQLSVPSKKSISSSPRSSNPRSQVRAFSHGTVIYPQSPCTHVSKNEDVSRHQLSKLQPPGEEKKPISSRPQNLTPPENGISSNSRPTLSERAVETLHRIPSSPAIRKSSNFLKSDLKSSGKSSKVNPYSTSPPNSNIGSVIKKSRSFTNDNRTFYFTQNSTPIKQNSTNKFHDKATPRYTGLHTPVPKSSKTKNNITSAKSSKCEEKTVQSLSEETKSPSRKFIVQKLSSPAFNMKEPKSIVISKNRSPKLPTDPRGNSGSLNSKSSRTASMSSSPGTKEKTPRKSSSALRDQIAKAKAVKRASILRLSGGTLEDVSDVPSEPLASKVFDDLPDLIIHTVDPEETLKKRIRSAQKDGKLNISAMGLKTIPLEVMNMYSLKSIEGISWGEVVNLTKLIAADNEIEEIPQSTFPDINSNELLDDDGENSRNPFCFLEVINLRGNNLKTLPIGLRKLEYLTTLNLLGNNLTIDCFKVISELISLRDLNLEQNKLSGQLTIDLTRLKNLVILNLRQNELSDLPDSLVELVELRKLNIASNKFKSLPLSALRQTSLTELIASKNNLSDILLPQDIKELPNLQILDVTSNSLTSLHSYANLRLPALQQLLCASNRLKDLPSLASCQSLVTIDAEDNFIEALPPDFSTLPKIKNVNLSGNNLRILDESLGKIHSLEVLHLSGNPLKEKKLAAMSTIELKSFLVSRIESEIEEEREVEINNAHLSGNESLSPSSPSFPPNTPISLSWNVLSPGVLDRSSTQSHSLNPLAAAQVAANHQIKVLKLHHNYFPVIPESIAFFATTLTTLDLSHNEFSSDIYMKDSLELPVLKELNLSSNTFSSLQPLLRYLHAPNLERLDVSFNRISSLPVLRDYFPKLTTLLISHNTITELKPETIKGIQVLDCSSNELNSLNARIGLLGGPEGLKQLDVRGNRFRVPKYTVLEKGTEATLAWLRDKIPAGEIAGSDVDEFAS